MAASEGVPFSKTGGLADVAGSLPLALKQAGCEVRLVLPLYRGLKEKFSLRPMDGNLLIPLGNRVETADIHEGKMERNIPVYFVGHERYFDREYLYQTPQADYEDNAERFTFFSRAVLECAKAVGFKPDIIHAHDWQTGLIPAYLKTLYRIDAFFNRTASVFTIHNLAYQGSFPKDTLFLTGLGWAEFTPDKLEFYDQISFLKSGLVYADALTTVSPTYAKEIQKAEFGRGLEGVLIERSASLFGILNGIDDKDWNPAKDKHIPKCYAKASLSGKAFCKKHLQEELGLDALPEVPILGMVTRLDDQKGLDIVASVLSDLLERKLQIALLGAGDKKYMDLFSGIAKLYPGKFSLTLQFNNPLAHRIYAGCDFFLMPSRFEPCGLGQLIAMRYGTLPIVHKTGGLADTVEETIGFPFAPLEGPAMLAAVDEALAVFARVRDLGERVGRAMSQDFSWKASSKTYLSLYQKLLKQ